MIKLGIKLRQIKKPWLDRCVGFGDVELYSGYEEHDTPYGHGIAYEDIEGMSFAALLAKIKSCECFTDKEKRNAESLLIDHCGNWIEIK